ncbi:5-methylaminomethyl-2-thiouridylate-methyltransferase, partial [Nadsonia fulvescens var. elongata DSM 6958]
MLYSNSLKKLLYFPLSRFGVSCRLTSPPKTAIKQRFIATAEHSPTIYSEHEPSNEDHIYVAMSSGVDSSTTAALMAQKYPGRVSGIFMNNWNSTSKCAEADWNDVQRVASFLGIPCRRVNFEKDYWLEVFEPMLEGYRNGYTPNPDVGCNRHIKFGALFEFLKQQTKKNNKNWWLATGHYAKVLKHNPTGVSHLLRPVDMNKDQSYYLSTVDPIALAKLLFPMAQYTKPEIRTIAAKFQLPTAFKPDSQGLCFVSNEHNHFKDFLAEYIQSKPGDIILQDGTVVGTHQGLWTATVGQKPPGLSMPQGNPKYKGSWFVCDKI